MKGTVRNSQTVTIALGQTGTATPACPPNSLLVGGGYEHSNPFPGDLAVYVNRPIEGTETWWVVAKNGVSAGTVMLTAYVVCVQV